MEQDDASSEARAEGELDVNGNRRGLNGYRRGGGGAGDRRGRGFVVASEGREGGCIGACAAYDAPAEI